MKFRVVTPSKVNLALRVVGRRSDGLHLLDMVVATTSFGDIIEGDITNLVAREGEIPLELTVVSGVPELESSVVALRGEGGSNNLAVRAWQHFFSLCGERPRRGRVTLTKFVPIGGGVGGGSGNAAAILLALWRLAGDEAGRRHLGLQNVPSFTDLLRSSVALGADVPVLMRRGWARVRGVGEIVEPLDMQSLSQREIAICWPGVGVNTASAFRWLRERGQPFSLEGSAPWSEESLYVNDLEQAARYLEPKVGALIDRLKEAALGPVVMSGSGSCVIVVGSASVHDPGAREGVSPFLVKVRDVVKGIAGSVVFQGFLDESGLFDSSPKDSSHWDCAS